MAGEDIETPPPHNHTGGQVRLPTFWAQAPAMWFAQAECLFELQGVTCQVKKYCYVVASLTHESMRRVSDLVEQRPDQDPYEVLKARLLSALQLTDYQRADKLFESPALGARKPSELMSQMLEICPRGEERSHLFACLFLRRLPREIRVLLNKVDHDNKKKEKSDRQGPSLAARLESGLCHGHWVYGESSTTCQKPCTWQGNGQAGGN